MNIRRIIAKEGLILMGVILLSCLICFISSIYPPYPKPAKTKFDITTAKPIEDTKKSDEEIKVNPLAKYIVEKSVTPEKKTKITYLDEETKGKGRLNFSDLLETTPEQEVDGIREKIRWTGLYILFIVYILYLIPIKFSVWAIRTLREK